MSLSAAEEGVQGPAGVRGAARVASAAACLASLALGAWIAFTHPIAPLGALLAFFAWSLVCARWPRAWLLGLPSVLPIMAFTTSTGRLIVEEWDLVVLGASSGGYAALAFARLSGAATRFVDAAGEAASLRASRFMLVLFVGFGLSGLYALQHGIAVEHFDLERPASQGYYDALNSLRIYRGWALAVLLVPLLAHALRTARGRALEALALGLAASGAVTALAVIYERVAYVGLTNFSTDYRVTGPFWEMHVGGAALDAYLALTFPFVLRLVIGQRSHATLALGLVLACAMGYASLVTFSRGVYLALPLALAVYVAAESWRLRATPTWSLRGILFGLGATALLCVGWWAIFRHGGYRGIAATLGTMVSAALLARGVVRPMQVDWIVAGAAGVALGGVALALAPWLPKGPYVAYAVCAALAIVAAWRATLGPDVRLRRAALALFVAQTLLAAGVMLHWGGLPALQGGALPLVVVVVATIASTLGPPIAALQPLRARLLVVVAAGATAAVVAAFSGGAYMSGRFATAGEDLERRLQHWQQTLAMLDRVDTLLLGRGLGRYPGDFFFESREGAFPGSYALASDGADVHLSLAGPRYPAAFGELFRVSQEIVPDGGVYTVSLDARAPRKALLHMEICAKHLLYSVSCVIASQPIEASAAWHKVSATLDTGKLEVTPWYAPRRVFFSMAVDSVGEKIEIDNVSLVSAHGTEALVNGTFGAGMARWFSSSDRTHLPWHTKSLALGVLYDQGLVGALLLGWLVVAACTRLAAGAASVEPLAPVVLAGLAGFLVVGVFDTIVDAPRVAFVFYLLLALAALL